MSINTAAILVEMNISVWTANKIDRAASIKVNSTSHASSDAGKYRKNLMAGTTKRKAIADYAAQCRLWHSQQTLPWSDKGSRLIPMSLFMDYKQEAATRRDIFDGMVTDFLANYEDHVAASEAHLGDLFDPNDYPSAAQVADKFGYRLVFSPLPDSGDFRVDAPAAEVEELRKQYEESVEERVAEAMQTPWNRLHEMLISMTDKLGREEQGKDTRWYDSFVTNATTLCQMLTHLNVAGDPKLELARKDLERAMMGVTIDDVREDDRTRENMKEQLGNILKGYEW